MDLARLLALVFALCASSAFAQQNQLRQTPPPTAANPAAASTLVASRNFSPEFSTEVKPPLDSLSQKDAPQIREQLNQDNDNIVPPPPDGARLRILTENAVGPDSTCYTMRSYVVARDSKDSDSTHLVGYSTCQPGSRYGLKTTELRQNSPAR